MDVDVCVDEPGEDGESLGELVVFWRMDGGDNVDYEIWFKKN